MEFGNEFICASIADKSWYQFREHKWEEIEDGVYLRSKISNEIVGNFSDQLAKASEILVKVQDKVEEALDVSTPQWKRIDGDGTTEEARRPETQRNETIRKGMMELINQGILILLVCLAEPVSMHGCLRLQTTTHTEW